MADIHDMNAARRGKPGNGLQPCSPQEAVALLTSCLALVRPVGMTENEAEDWLSVAMGVVMEYPAVTLRDAARQAQRSCTHHAQIVPTIAKFCDETAPRHDPLMAAIAHVPDFEPMKALPAPDRKITQAMVDAMSPELIRMGLTCQALIRDADGNVMVNPR